jgi:hypothetical protein
MFYVVNMIKTKGKYRNFSQYSKNLNCTQQRAQSIEEIILHLLAPQLTSRLHSRPLAKKLYGSAVHQFSLSFSQPGPGHDFQSQASAALKSFSGTKIWSALHPIKKLHI